MKFNDLLPQGQFSSSAILTCKLKNLYELAALHARVADSLISRRFFELRRWKREPVCTHALKICSNERILYFSVLIVPPTRLCSLC
jgi:hypothetical protein